MTKQDEAQEVFERYLRHELTLHEAADTLLALVSAQKATGAAVKSLQIPDSSTAAWSQATFERGTALFEELDRRAGLPQ